MSRLGKYDARVRRQVVDLSEQGLGMQAIASVTGLPKGTIEKWVWLYRRHGIQGTEPVSMNQKYSFETKKAAVEAFLGGQAKQSVLEQFGIRNKTQLDNWMRLYREQGADGLLPKTRGRPAGDPDSVESLQEKVQRLEMENAALKKLQALAALERRRGSR